MQKVETETVGNDVYGLEPGAYRLKLFWNGEWIFDCGT